MERNNKLELLGNAPIPKALMSLGVPIMIGMLINALYNLVDAYFVGALGDSQMGAISIIFPLGQVVVGLGLMFGNGAASYLSRLLGSGDKDNCLLFDLATEPLEETAERLETLQEIGRALEQLPPLQRWRFILHFFYGYSYSEIAKMQDCNKSAVMRSVHSALKKIRNNVAA